MAAAIGWYGPLINLSNAASHLGEYVQLLVFVHRSTPIQYKLPKGGEVIRTDIQVGDDTRPIFPVSLWRKQMANSVQLGSIILLENVRITKFGDTIEARTVQYSTLRCLFSHIESFGSEGVDDMIKDCRVGLCTKDKLKKVVEWVQRKGYTLIRTVKSCTYKEDNQQPANWKVHEERESNDLSSLLELSLLTNSCEAKLYASVGDIFLPRTSKNSCEFEDERMFIRRRLFTCKVEELAEDLICTGCQLCGFPLNCEMGSMLLELNTIPLYCPKSSNHVHQISSIYRPFVVCCSLGIIHLEDTCISSISHFGNTTFVRFSSSCGPDETTFENRTYTGTVEKNLSDYLSHMDKNQSPKSVFLDEPKYLLTDSHIDTDSETRSVSKWGHRLLGLCLKEVLFLSCSYMCGMIRAISHFL